MSRHRPRSAPRETRKWCATPFESVALLLQGGGALGAYQAGVYEALIEHNIEPTWIAGISIGAINSAIIAGNPVSDRVAKLRAFWELVSDAGDGGLGNFWSGLLHGDKARGFANSLAAGAVMSNGVRGFFTPRFPPPYLASGGADATSWYDTAALKTTLEGLVDFDRINAGGTRFSVGAVNVATGNFAYFDNATDVIRAEHIMASGALPPAFPAIEIDGEFYWDGGMVSNTPLDWVLSSRSDLDTLVLQVDLWSARGEMPTDLAAVAVRMKEVQFSSRTRAATDAFRRTQELRAAFNELLAQMPDDLKASPQAKLLTEASDPAVFNIVQLVYRSPTYEGQSKDYEFSRRTMEEHWRAGHRDAVHTLSHPEVLTLPTAAHGVEVYDFTTPHHDEPATSAPAAVQPIAK
ncbi:patatin-like phospholipase family protein [Sphingosinicellaceae bacterium]|nr:patatin-like phospholipase family protein [Sphingosinicellaceae bacterium]